MLDKQRITDQEFIALRDYIYRRCGIYFTEKNRFILETRVKEIFKESSHKSLADYIRSLDDARMGSTELSRLLTKVTITETSFFRDKYQIGTIEKNIIPEMVRKNDQLAQKQLRIWSAACSSGEEAHTMAILVAEHLKDQLPRWNVTIFATDINDNALKACKEGVYSTYALRNTDEHIKQKYFTKVGEDSFKVKPEIARMVTAEKCNLMDYNACRKYANTDLLLIRNVLIYFDTASKTKVLKMCYDNLKPGGCLFLGHSETIFGIDTNFKLVNFVNAFGYTKLSDNNRPKGWS